MFDLQQIGRAPGPICSAAAMPPTPNLRRIGGRCCPRGLRPQTVIVKGMENQPTPTGARPSRCVRGLVYIGVDRLNERARGLAAKRAGLGILATKKPKSGPRSVRFSGEPLPACLPGWTN